MAKHTGLGKGLESLIPGTQQAQNSTAENYVPITMIQRNPRQPRDHMDEENLQELASSIREHGILQPLIVTHDPVTGLYTLIAGERRLRAAAIAGLDKVPVVIRTASDQERLELALIENVQRDDLSPLETAEAYHQLADQFNLSHEQIAQRVGKSRVAVTNTLRLLKLPAEVQQALTQERISEGHARCLLSLATDQAMLAALQTVLANDLNVRQTEELVKRLSGIKPPSPTPKNVDENMKAVEDSLREKLGTKVDLKKSGKGGVIAIHYYSDEELEHWVNFLSKN